MASRFFRFYPVFAEWSALGTFVLLGDLSAQKLEHSFKPKHTASVRPEIVAIHKVAAVELINNAKLEAAHHDVAVASAKQSRQHDSDQSAFQIDYTRLLAASCTGLLWIAPICMLWFPLLHRFMAKHFAHLVEGSLKYVFIKVFLENSCLAAPVCLGYFTIPAVIEGGEDWWGSLVSRLESHFPTTLATDVSFWCVASPINYKFIPVRFQPAFSCILGGVEAAGLSLVAHQDPPAELVDRPASSEDSSDSPGGDASPNTNNNNNAVVVIPSKEVGVISSLPDNSCRCSAAAEIS